MEGEQLTCIEDEFNLFIEELKSEPGLDRLTVEYMNIFNALKASQNRVINQKKKFSDIKEALLIESIGVESVLKMTQSDDAVRKKLLKQIDTVRGAIEKLKERETKNEQKLIFLNQNITAIEEDIKKADMLNKHIGVLDEKAGELDLLKNEIGDLGVTEESINKTRIELQKSFEETDAEKEQMIQREIQLHLQSDDLNSVLKFQEAEKDEIISELEELKIKNENISEEKNLFVVTKKELRDDLRNISQKLLERLKINHTLEKQHEKVLLNLNEYKKKITRDQNSCEEILKQKTINIKQIQEKEIIKNNIDTEIEIYDKEINSTRKKINELQQARQTMHETLEKNRKAVLILENKFDEAIVLRDEDAQKIITLTREINLLRESANKVEHFKKKISQEIQNTIKRKICIFNERIAEETNVQNFNNILVKEKKFNQRVIQEKTVVENQIVSTQETLKARIKSIENIQNKVLLVSAGLNKQKTLLEAVKTESLLYSKQMIDAKGEIMELRRRYKVFLTSVFHLKEELEQKENLIKKQNAHSKEAERNCIFFCKIGEALVKNLSLKQEKYNEINLITNELKNKIEHLNAREAKLKTQLGIFIGERDTLSLQLTKKREFFDLLEEKTKITCSLLFRAEFKQKIKQIQIYELKTHCKNLTNKVKSLFSEITKLPHFYIDIQFLQKELTNSRIKKNYLLEELTTFINIHNWRKISSIDQKSYELSFKCQSLQKRFIKKCEEVKIRKKKLTQIKINIKQLNKKISKNAKGPDGFQCNKIFSLVQQKQSRLEKFDENINTLKCIHDKSIAKNFNVDIQIKEIKKILTTNLLRKKKIFLRNNQKKENILSKHNLKAPAFRLCH